MKRLLLPALFLATASVIAGEDANTGVRMTAQEIASAPAVNAGPGSSGLAGIRTAVLSGDPTRAGLYTIALTVPAHTRIGSHHHRDERSATVVSGDWYFGYGPNAEASARRIGPGGFYTEPAGMPHFARTGSSPATVYITGTGPTDTQYEKQPSASE